MNNLHYRDTSLMRNTVRRELQVIADRDSADIRGVWTVPLTCSAEEDADSPKVGYRRVYRETVIVDDDRILIGVPTGESDLVLLRSPAG